MASKKNIIELTDEEFGWVQYCIEFITANERSFDKDEEKTLKSIAKKFSAEYIADANLNYDSWNEDVIENDETEEIC